MGLEEAGADMDRAVTRRGFRGVSFENTFAGAPSFLRRTYAKDLSGARIAVTGIPYDQSVTNRPGARFGPRAIREASLLQSYDPPMGWEVNPLTDFDVADHGDMAFDYAAPAGVPEAIEAHIAGILEQDCAVIVLGGDHAITLPILRAHAKAHGRLALVQFDAHTDTWVDDDPARFDHGTGFYKAVKEGIVNPDASIQVGIRTVNPDSSGMEIIDAPECHRIGPAEIARRILARVGGTPAYVSFDIDALDPAFAPGTGTPVWGGLASWQAAAVLRGMRGLPMVGGDVVEVSPPYDAGGATAIAGAHVATELLCLWCDRHPEAR